MEINLDLSKKQWECWTKLSDENTTEILYGGGAGGGKSHLACAWLIFMCVKYPGTRYLLGRARLKTLRESTLLTLFKLLKDWGFERNVDWSYNGSDHYVQICDSSIYLKDLFLYPTDPEFDSLGSTEYTSAVIDEASEITHKAKMILMSRLRFKLVENKLTPKLLIMSNPAKNFMYSEFYMPWKKGLLPKFRCFIPALVQDNPYMPRVYIDNLKKLDENSKQRLLYGNWEYEDDPSKLFAYEDIMDVFTNPVKGDGEKYLTVDVARFGSDKTVFCYWDGWNCYKIEYFEKKSTKRVRELIERACSSDGIPRSHVIIDEDGIGGGVVDETEGVYGFVNNSKPIVHNLYVTDKQVKENDKMVANFRNLKTQCYFLLSDKVRKHEVGVRTDDIGVREWLIQDLEQIKQKDIDKDDSKISLVSKEEIKEFLGRSTDFSDAIMMRGWFDLRKSGVIAY